MQFHSTADLHTITPGSGTTILATLYSAAATATSNPAVTSRNVGSNGGRAVAFTYDLAKSIIYTRQEIRRGGKNVMAPADTFVRTICSLACRQMPQLTGLILVKYNSAGG
jgi:hypothetical protein